MRIIFMSSSSFGLPALQALRAHFNVIAVYTTPPKAVGRGYIVQKTLLHKYALSYNIPVETPTKLQNTEKDIFQKYRPDIGIVVSYGLLLPKSFLKIPTLQFLNIHGSLLPALRGASPIQHAILIGLKKTGITIMQMDPGMDTGPILLQKTCLIDPRDTTKTLANKLSVISAHAIVEAINTMPTPIPQDHAQATYTYKIKKEDGIINFQKESAMQIARRIRAFIPWPGCFFSYNNKLIRILAAEAINQEHHLTPGIVLNDKLHIACQKGILCVLRLQRPSRKALDTKEFLLGYPIPKGTVL